jgi:hypothetical protein
MLSKKEIQQDLNYLHKKMVNWYPGLGYYVSKERYGASQDSTQINLPDSLSYLQLYQKVTFLVSLQKDGHLSAWHRKKYSIKTTRYLPFSIRQVNEKYFIVFNVSPDSSLCRGD